MLFITDQNDVAWQYLETTLTKMVDWTNRLPLFSRKVKEFEFKEEDFRDAVVMPSYRNQGLHSIKLILKAFGK